MKKIQFMILLFCTMSVFSNDSFQMKKNFITIEYNFLEFNFLTFLGYNFDFQYTRTIHKRMDISTSLGVTSTYGNFISDEGGGLDYISYGKFSLIPFYTPIRRKNKVLQFGVGYIAGFHSRLPSLHGLSVQLNFLKQSKKKHFCYGFNFYNDLLFKQKQPYYALGIGVAIGGAFGKR